MSESAKETIERQTFVIENQAESIFVQTNALASARDENLRLRTILKGIVEYCSGDGQPLGAIERLAAIRNTAERALTSC